MTLHIFGTILTHRGVASNNRGEVEAGTISTLQKVIRHGDLYSTVSGEAIRYALREVWPQVLNNDQLNRPVPLADREWKDPTFAKPAQYVDDDVLGFMLETNNRRGVLEIARAVSTTPWPGTVTNHFASVGAQPRKETQDNPNWKRGNPDPIPYTAEVHDTRYQYTFAMTPDALQKDKLDRTKKTLWALRNLRRVGGGHARFLYDFSPEMVVLRLTEDPAPRIMNCFTEHEERGTISLKPLINRMIGDDGDDADINASEVVVGGVPIDHPVRVELNSFTNDRITVTIKRSVKAAFAHLLGQLAEGDGHIIRKDRECRSYEIFAALRRLNRGVNSLLNQDVKAHSRRMGMNPKTNSAALQGALGAAPAAAIVAAGGLDASIGCSFAVAAAAPAGKVFCR